MTVGKGIAVGEPICFASEERIYVLDFETIEQGKEPVRVVEIIVHCARSSIDAHKGNWECHVTHRC